MQNKFSSEPYSPAEDTYFLEDNILDEKGKIALDIGTGTGYLTRTLSQNFSKVIGTDIDFDSLLQNKKVDNRICCNGADALYCKFDLIVCNMPYLQSDEIQDRRVDGGPEGVKVPLEIIKSAVRCLDDSGKMLFVTSTLANYEKLIKKTEELGFSANIISRKKLFFEELLLVEVKKLFS